MTLAFPFTGCNTESGALSLSAAQGDLSAAPVEDDDNSAETPKGGCVSSDPNHMCIGLKVVSYKDTGGEEVLSRSEAVGLVNGINEIWKTCNIAFQLDEYVAVDPADYGLSFGSGAQSQTGSIRQAFSNGDTFLVVVTGSWNSSYIAWTAMPGSSPYGVVATSEFGSDPITIGHELGHYQGLDHSDSSSNLLYPYISSATQNLTASQCESARQVNLSYWKAMLRY